MSNAPAQLRADPKRASAASVPKTARLLQRTLDANLAHPESVPPLPDGTGCQTGYSCVNRSVFPSGSST